MGHDVSWLDVVERVGVAVLMAALCVIFLPAFAVVWVMLENTGSHK